MTRRFRWILLGLIAVVIAGAVALVVVERPKLDDAQNAVDARWAPLRAPAALVVRYQKLEGALSAFDAAGGKGRAVSKELHAALDAWQTALKSGGAGEQAARANVLEAQSTRLLANFNGSDRLKANVAVKDALVAFAGTKPPAAMISAYNAAVRKFEDERTGTLQRPVARVLGYNARPLLILGI